MGMPPVRQHSRTNWLSCGNRPLPCSWMKAVSNIPEYLGQDRPEDHSWGRAPRQAAYFRPAGSLLSSAALVFAGCNAIAITDIAILPPGAPPAPPHWLSIR